MNSRKKEYTNRCAVIATNFASDKWPDHTLQDTMNIYIEAINHPHIKSNFAEHILNTRHKY